DAAPSRSETRTTDPPEPGGSKATPAPRIVSAAPPSAAPAPAAEPTWRVLGRVTESGGAPVAGAEVRIQLVRSSFGEPVAVAPTSADGSYSADVSSLRTLSPISRTLFSLVVRASAPGHRPAAPVKKPVPADPTSPQEVRLDIVLEQGGVVHGRVIDSEGRGVPSAYVTLF